MSSSIVGGVIRPTTKLTRLETTVTVTWRWYDESQGIVEWTFANTGSEQQSVVLFRNGYYFGNAFYGIYLGNSEYNTSFTTSVTPLVDNGVENNTPPYGIIQIGSQYIPAFVFTLAPSQTWSMLEGGFSSVLTPSDIAVYPLKPLTVSDVCVHYDPQQVVQWDLQTQTLMGGYMPNPKTFTSMLFATSGDAKFVNVFPGDWVKLGSCQAMDCSQYVTDAIKAANDGDFLQTLEYVIKAASCYASNQ